MDAWSHYRFFQQQQLEEARYRYAPAMVAVADPRRLLADSAERELAARLLIAGHAVARTGRNERFDLVVDGRLRVEVKASTWTAAAHGRGRYGALLHNRADLVCWLIAPTGTWFIIPMRHLGKRTYLSVTSQDPASYRGQWASYRGRWDWIDALLAELASTGVEVAYQPRLI